MVSLLTQKDLKVVRKLPFCCWCGKPFVDGENVNRDHLPAKNLFAPRDREPALLLPTHANCNTAHSLVDEKIGQLIALPYGKVPPAKVRRLRFALSRLGTHGAVVNLDIDSAVWRWIAGFHAALYQSSPVGIRGSLVTPFPRGQIVNGLMIPEVLRPQDSIFVKTIQENRIKNNLDRIVCNGGTVTFECVWCQSDDGRWMCIYALDVYRPRFIFIVGRPPEISLGAFANQRPIYAISMPQLAATARASAAPRRT